MDKTGKKKMYATDFTVPGSCSSCDSLDVPQDSSRAQSVHQCSTSTGRTFVKDCIISEVYVENDVESTENEGTFDVGLPGSVMSYIITTHRSPSTSTMSPLSTADDLVLSEEIDQLLSDYVPRSLAEMEENSDVLPVLPDSFVQELLEEVEHEAEKQPEKMATLWTRLKMRKPKVVPLSCGQNGDSEHNKKGEASDNVPTCPLKAKYHMTNSNFNSNKEVRACSQPEAKEDATSISSVKMKELLIVADKMKRQVNTCTCPNQTTPIPDYLFFGASETNLQNMETACNSFKEDTVDTRPSSAQGSKPSKDTGSKRTSLWNFFKGLTKKLSKTSPDNATGPSESDHVTPISSDESKTDESKTDESKTDESKTDESKTEKSKTEKSKTGAADIPPTPPPSNKTKFSWKSWRGRFTKAYLWSKLKAAYNWYSRNNSIVMCVISALLFIALIIVLLYG